LIILLRYVIIEIRKKGGNMTKYSIDFGTVERKEDSSYISIKVVEPIESNESNGDQIGIYKEENVLEFDENIDIEDDEIRNFIKEYFRNYTSVLGFIRRLVN